MYNNQLTLISESTTSRDNQGNAIRTTTLSTVFCEEISIGQSEFYQAHASGFKPEFKLKIADYLDYNGQKKANYNGKKYDVLRTYKPPNSNVLEITLHGGVIDVSS